MSSGLVPRFLMGRERWIPVKIRLLGFSGGEVAVCYNNFDLAGVRRQHGEGFKPIYQCLLGKTA